MKYDPETHHRRSIRLKGYNYSQPGVYFVTICIQNRECLFGEIVDRGMVLNDAGRVIQTVWNELPIRFSDIALDKYVIMSNHIHGIITLVGAPLVGAQSTDAAKSTNANSVKRAGTRPAPTNTGTGLGDIVGAFKSITTHEYINGVKQHGWTPFSGKLWQRNYYEHVIRNENELNQIREYIANNPLNWEWDQENPDVSILDTTAANDNTFTRHNAPKLF